MRRLMTRMRKMMRRARTTATTEAIETGSRNEIDDVVDIINNQKWYKVWIWHAVSKIQIWIPDIAKPTWKYKCFENHWKYLPS